MVRLVRRTTSDKVELRPSDGLNMEMNNSRGIGSGSPRPEPEGQGLRHGGHRGGCGGGGAGGINQPKRKLNAMTGIRGQSCYMNDPKRLKALKAQFDLAESVAEYTRVSRAAKMSKRDADVSGLFGFRPSALLRLREKGDDLSEITKKDICAIARRYVSVTLEEKTKKELLEAALQAQVTARPGALPAVVLDAAASLLRARRLRCD